MLIYGCKEKLVKTNYTIILSSLLHNIYIVYRRSEADGGQCSRHYGNAVMIRESITSKIAAARQLFCLEM